MNDERTSLKVPYGVSDFGRIRDEDYYYVDKTAYIARLEERDSFVFFVRPRRFGKSLFLDTLRTYYDLSEKDNFERYFKGLWIGAHPTPERNRYMVLTLDFSRVNVGTEPTLQDRFNSYMATRLDLLPIKYPGLFGEDFSRELKAQTVGRKLEMVAGFLKTRGIPLYLMIDEYDNFTNQLIRSSGNEPYKSITHGSGFYREWFKSFKGTFDRIFMTGVSPITMDDLTSGFNIAKNLTQDEDFNAMLGFTSEETLRVFTDFQNVGRNQSDPAEVVKAIKPWYDGYCFAEEKVDEESVFNSDMVLYYLGSLVAKGRPPKNMVDSNIATDYDKLETIVDLQRQSKAAHIEDVQPIIDDLASAGEIDFDLVESFPVDKLIEPANFRSLFHYYGIVSMSAHREGRTFFKVPNHCVRMQMFNYLRDSYEREERPDWIDWDRLASRMAYRGEWRPFLERLAKDYAQTTTIRGAVGGEVRIQGYMQAEFGHLRYFNATPELELNGGFCDFFLFPERTYFGDVQHSYIVELKHSKKDASDAELAEKAEEGIRQLRQYAADRFVPVHSRGTTLHLILFQFRGKELVRLEEIPA